MGAARLMGERITNRKVIKSTLGSMVGGATSDALAGVGLKGIGAAVGVYKYKKVVPRLSVSQARRYYAGPVRLCCSLGGCGIFRR
ncbi:hypothetical protein GCM10027200_67080 [Lentzea nigeriaca]